jgi:rhodanese-related sulfurtransferase
MKICASCEETRDLSKIVRTNEKEIPEWLSKVDYVSSFIEKVQHFDTRRPPRSNLTFTIDLPKKTAGRSVLYWGASPSKTGKVQDAKKAYGDFSNHGITPIDRLGRAIIKMQCPQSYKTIPHGSKTPRVYPSHMHFAISNIEKNKWLPTVYTKLVTCHINKKEMKKISSQKSSIILNALPPQYYGVDHIPNSYNLPVKDAKKMTKQELKKFLIHLVDLHYPLLKMIPIEEVPIITYCAHEGCNASELLSHELLKKGLVNIREYKGGMKEWREKK